MSGGVRLTGFDALNKMLDRTPGEFVRVGNKKVLKCAHLLKSAVLHHFDDQDLGHKDLSEAYKKRKDDKGLSPDTLRATNAMYSAVTAVGLKTLSAVAGVKRGGAVVDGEDVADIALYHEQIDPETFEDVPGEVMPKRQVWKPSMEEVTPMTKKILGDALEDAVKASI